MRHGCYEALSGEGIDDIPEIRQAIAGDLPVPATSVYSRTDGIVNWRTCVLRPSATAENIEVYFASHIGLGVNPAALGPSPTAWRWQRASSSNLTGRAPLPLPMRPRKMHNPDRRR